MNKQEDEENGIGIRLCPSHLQISFRFTLFPRFFPALFFFLFLYLVLLCYLFIFININNNNISRTYLSVASTLLHSYTDIVYLCIPSCLHIRKRLKLMLMMHNMFLYEELYLENSFCTT